MKTTKTLVTGMIATAVLLTTVKQVSAAPVPPMTIVAEAAGGTIVFVEDAGAIAEGASDWPPAKLTAVVKFYEEAVARYTAASAFGSVERWAKAFGISVDNPIRVVYAGKARDTAPARATWIAGMPVITHYALRTSVSTAGVKLVVHELAHIWDGAHNRELGEAIETTVQNPDGFPTAKARDEGSKEDFAESVTATLWPGYAVNESWSDDEPGRSRRASAAPDTLWTMDRHDYVESLY